MKRFLMVLLMVPMAGTLAPAATVSFPASKDSILMVSRPDANRGYGGQMFWEADSTVLVQFDLSSVTLAPGEYIESATLELFAGHEGPFGSDDPIGISAQAMRVDWQEGVGTTGGAYGSTGFPWGPASVGDAVFNYRSVTSVAPGTGPFSTVDVATAGDAWEVAGALGTTQDCYPELLIDESITTAAGPWWVVGDSIAVLDLTGDGLAAVEGWVDGSLANNGIVMALDPVGATVANAYGSYLRVATREASGISGTGVGLEVGEVGPIAPTLTLNIVPEPATLALLAMGGVAMLRRRK